MTGSAAAFRNDRGLAEIRIGVMSFLCAGETPPQDHPHVYIDMGKDDDIVCPYCSTHYLYNARLAPGTAEPASAIYNAELA